VLGLGRRQLGFIAAIVAATVAAGALHYAGADATTVFALSALALAGLAWLVSFATEEIGARFGPSMTGVLQSTLGNLPELFIVIFAIRAGETVVAQTSILGSLFANGLLVLGAAIVVGARRGGGVMRFSRRLPNDTATLLLLAVFIIVVLGVSDRVGDRASRHQIAISAVGAVCLLVVYVAWLVPYLRRGTADEKGSGHEALVPLSVSIGLLAVAGVGAALVSDWFVAAIDPAVRRLGISKTFTGLVIVAIAGNAVENVVGIALAAKQKYDLAISVVKNSVAQIAAFLFPALVLISLAFDTRLTFVLDPVFAGALLLTAIGVWQITGDGEAFEYEGWALVALFAVLATLAFYE
jgi:Ca2+:H+ antiporter